MPERLRRLVVLVAAVTVLAVAAACSGKHSTVTGSGNAKTENRNVGEFSKVRVDGAANVVVTIGSPSTFAVTADDNLLADVKTTVSKDELTVTTPSNVKPVTPIKVEATVPSLTDAQLNGLGDISVNGVTGKSFSTQLKGTGSVSATGKADTLTVRLDGLGKVEMGGLATQQADVTLNGTGNVAVNAEKKLKARVNGAGTVTYTGQPQLDAKVTGAGSVTKAP